MKTVKAIDLLRHRLILVPVPEELELTKSRFILVKRDWDEIVARVLDIVPGSLDVDKKDKPLEFVKELGTKDLEAFEKGQSGEKQRIQKVQKHVDKLKLGMRVFASRMGWRGKIISFFFTCDEAVDFRELLKVLGSEFKCRIHLERVGARDKARVLGGFGSCGRETCCSTFKRKLVSVPMDSARDQGIMIKENDKILGACGKLKCCLMYELPMYRKKRKTLPHIRQAVITKNKHKGRVIGLDILNQKVKVLLLDTDMIEVFDVADISVESRNRKEKK